MNKSLIRRLEKLEQRNRQELQNLNRVTYEEFKIIYDLTVRLEDPIEREAFMREPPKSKDEVGRLKGSDKFKYGFEQANRKLMLSEAGPGSPEPLTPGNPQGGDRR